MKEQVIIILEKFKEELEDGWDNAFEQLDSRYQDNDVVFLSDYAELLRSIIKIYYKSYLFMIDNDFDGGLTFELRQRQVYLLLAILKELKLEQAKKEILEVYEQVKDMSLEQAYNHLSKTNVRPFNLDDELFDFNTNIATSTIYKDNDKVKLSKNFELWQEDSSTTYDLDFTDFESEGSND